MNIIVLGPPGSGKGTQAQKLAERLGYFYFESGGFSRELAEEDARIKSIVEDGQLIPEKEMTSYVSKHLESKVPERDNIVFDGYPRFIGQYEDLEKWLNKKSKKIDRTFILEVSDEEIIKRLTARRTCTKCGRVYNLITNPPVSEKCECGGELTQRSDDEPDVIKKRLEEFRKNTLPMLEYIEAKGTLEKVDGERPIEVIFEDILARLGVNDG